MKQYLAGISGGGKAYFVLERSAASPVTVVVTASDSVAVWQDNLSALAPLFSVDPDAVVSFLPEDQFGRLLVLKKLAESAGPLIIITTAAALVGHTTALASFRRSLIRFEVDGALDPAVLAGLLVERGYRRDDFVEEKGMFSSRGEIVDIWPPDQPAPWRLVFNYSVLESIKTFEVVTQRSGEFLPRASLIPAADVPEQEFAELIPTEAVLYYDELAAPGAPDQDEPPAQYDFSALPSFAGNFRMFAAELRKFNDRNIKIFCANTGDQERMDDILHEQGLPELSAVLTIGPLQDGFYSPSRGIVFCSAQQVLYRRRPVHFPKFKTGRRLEGLWEITPRDFVVHEKYGIGKYLGLKKLVRGEQIAEYLCVEYKGGDKLYVPVDDFKVVQKYVGIEGYRPKLYSLDTASWTRVTQRARESAQKLAEELLKLYAERNRAQGTAFVADTPWERELADSFPYQETPDQLKAIDDVRNDLMQERPMERLICGDVGFGKTEVAIRAAFKVVQSSKQVAVLVPTTVLAEQHYNTFINRLAPFPVKIAFLSRFQTKQDQKKILADMAAGTVDIVIGTHRLIQKDVLFKDLGLLVIDEEHRFGVKQKEKIKAIKKNIDVLLLSATPIPRTLSLAMANMRDLSVIETPPYGRLPIETHLGAYNEEAVKTIIQAELARGGQVYYVYNRVETIISKGAHLKRLVPDVRWGIIHGQLPAAAIEKTMWQFLHKEIDVLIATTIIESGLDIPSVNTMIIEEAEYFGLAQLYQLRGRIGRERQKAYCYLFYTPALLTPDSQKRLEALQEFGELGAGFRLALRDLEIRGAGSILSAQQHGFVRDVGFDLYSRLLEEASHSLGGAPAPRVEAEPTTIDFGMPAYIPEEYMPLEDIRIVFYRRLSAVVSPEDSAAIRAELIDRFGVLPAAVANLLRLAGLKLAAARKQVRSIVEDKAGYQVTFSPTVDLPPGRMLALAEKYQDSMSFVRGNQYSLRFDREKLGTDPVGFIEQFLVDL
ncbi:MAG: transcription-repair coupling factor [Elusimicrobia bacterium]|nr:transcription-repair coupling factor [Elusimicrobiota bacterium]